MKCVFVVVILGALFTGCGGGSGPASPGMTITGGNWSFASTSVNSSSHLILFGGSLQQSGSTITGILNIGFSECFSPLAAFSVTGRIHGDSVTMKTSAVENQVVTIKGTVSGPKTLLGTFSVAGGCADGDSGSVVGTYVPPLTGTWKATENAGGSPITITLNLSQSNTVSSQGYFSITGTVQYTGSPCAISGATEPSVSFVSGNLVAIMVNTSEIGGDTGQILYAGVLDDPSTATSFRGFDNVLTGSCTSSGQLLTFTKQ